MTELTTRIDTLLSIAGLAGLWWLLSGGGASSWLIGVPVVLAAAWASRRLGGMAAPGLSISGLARLAPFFLRESVRGGVDVARRVLVVPMRIAPGFATYPLRLRHPGARLLFANSVSLLPGTLSVDLRDDCLAIHALDRDSDFTGELRRVESAVGRVFGEAL
ncbi:MAG: Na+/H+ antiporter subunit E [Gammaproteobacteria bacterium]|nr:Na+/H+ antiporter subunit E [Gammaproteobacteria bacterium]